MKKLIILLTASILFLTGCSVFNGSTGVDGSNTPAWGYLENQGYKVLSYEGIVDKYTLSKELLMTYPYSLYWGLQTEDPAKHMGKEITVEKFVVNHHPLDNWQSGSKDPKNNVKAKGKTDVWVYTAENQIVGGHSFPVVDQKLFGGVYSIDGRTLEEVHSISLKEWSNNWKTRFGEGSDSLLKSGEGKQNPEAKSSLGEIYSLALDSFMPIDDGLNGEIKYIAIDTRTLNGASEQDKKVVLRYFEKYGVQVIDESFESLNSKGMLKDGNYLEGILLSVSKIEFVSDKEVIVEGSKYRSGDGAIGVRCKVIYKDDKWQLEKADMMWIS